ncbi:MAG TPA: UDP-N-acetylglucosamine 2-epimerase (non-hydrolyzing) [Bacteroidales bacterium]|nr:UDP-N-acetylglucosamine 2-epimerase (non-hydrolyzing) [Bacteroidales bacterium]HRZ48443.1 UDP-N-acetylglucosamine 2-epimerase (non-hydrolyzing) [Bacteroidales bacterium]
MKVVTVIGARPQFIKAAVVSAAFRDTAGSVKEVLVHTGQHFDDPMSRVFFEQMMIPEPAYHLGVHSLSHGAMTGRMMELLEEVLLQEKPDALMVYGDTNSTLAGALVASKLHIPVAHVESGLRSFDMLMPEEINRIVTDRLSRWLFCPTATAVRNLEAEGFRSFPAEIIMNGDVMLDAALRFRDLARKPEEIHDGEFILATVHRPATTDNPAALTSVFHSLAAMAHTIPVVIPLHPRTSGMLSKYGVDTNLPGVTLIPPVGYLESLWLLQHARMVVTDSGGLQKEAYFFSKPCLTLRDETEWKELVEAGVNITAGTSPENIMTAFNILINLRFVPDLSLYGNGEASRIIAKTLA